MAVNVGGKKYKISVWFEYDFGVAEIEGETFPIKETIKRFGGRWDPGSPAIRHGKWMVMGKRGRWIVPLPHFRDLMNALEGQVEHNVTALDWKLYEMKMQKAKR